MGWKPGTGWRAMPPGKGRATQGVWATPEGWVVKRLRAGTDEPWRWDYWRRETELARSGLVDLTAGLRAPRCVKVDEDADGVNLWFEPVRAEELTPAELAVAIGRFSRNDLPRQPWFARGTLADRLAETAPGQEWSVLAGVLPGELGIACGRLWEVRADLLAELDAQPQIPMHGDAHPGNLLGRLGTDVIAIDWEQFGIGPVGFDLAYLVVTTTEPLESLLAAWTDGAGRPSPVLRRSAVLVAAITLLARAAWAQTQPAPEARHYLDLLTHRAEVVLEAASQAR